MTAASPADRSRPRTARTAAAVLSLVLLGACLLSDALVANSMLSLPLVVALAISALTTAWGVPRLRRLKLGQVIREEGPQGHLSKAGTPTMGGLLVVPVGVLVGGLVSPEDPRLLAIAAITLAYMAIGAVDDWRSLTKLTNTGLSPRGKLMLQAGAALLFLLWAAQGQWLGGADGGDIALPFGWILPLGLLIWPLGLFVFLAESNATNLTDGLDGLAAGCGAVVFTGMGLQLMLRGHEGDPALAAFCVAMAGCWLGFLAHNRHPARLFMGDTGSLAMGAALTAVALLSNSLWPLLLMGGVFLAESLSVILQVWVFKATKGADGQGRRLFRMAPLHHHFELGGISEQRVVFSFWGASLLLVLMGLVLLP
ncbi:MULTISPECIES: phospho-N-acetylmuramoyl-pentapeptide-transferase [unclassified Synechococcus]|uniref:phospho-N-acetylmuramoyl-pentapeptide- transferase n=1 Tax=unclassified Synechococcus TaxID=2626047 RepID=UPI0018CE99EC|nr:MULTISPECIES: phospho-N-acetylmuramoyl-pentapeptide-transferase [unclassified Synechococcus]MEA5423260.1 phospho-N-acetylmuramoyl-pentapeptide-transferase [Synechococcus sp. CCY9202]QPN61532.1 phospho-N-acetylmuramoyl-pentapeptide-transferase [Synechococcus sp. CBW1002]QPN67476.1 phospho-N-acetylmuramoyl-pentapeptide-transferase [Synechococcus sp. CBW1006]